MISNGQGLCGLWRSAATKHPTGNLYYLLGHTNLDKSLVRVILDYGVFALGSLLVGKLARMNPFTP